MRCFLLLFFITNTYYLGIGQVIFDFGGAHKETIHQMIANGEGNIVAIGTTESSTKKGKDIYFLVVNHDGVEKVVKNIGRVGDEEGFSIIQSFDGAYILAGYSSNKNEQKKGWLVKVDEKGKVLWDKVIPGRGESQLKEIVQLDNGSFWAVGEQDQKIHLFHFDELGEKLQTFPVVEEISTANSLLALTNGHLLINGVEQIEKGEKRVVLLEVNTDGQIIWKQPLNPEDIEKSKDCIETFDGGLAIVGSTTVRGLREEMSIVKTSSEGQKIWSKTFGGKGLIDRANALLQMPNEDLMVVGTTTSHKKGAKKSDLWLHRVNSKSGDPVWTQSKNFGGNYKDEGNAILRLRDGTLRLGGQKWTKLKEKEQAWIEKFLPIISELNNETANLQANFIRIKEANNNSYLDASERGYIHLELSNNSAIDALDIEGIITTRYKVKGFKVPSKVYVQRIPAGGAKIVSIPITADEEIRSGINKVIVKFKATNSKEILEEEFFIESEKKPAPNLEFAFNPQQSDSLHYFGKKSKLAFTLKNTGNATAKNITYKIILPNEIRIETAKDSTFNLLPNEELNIEKSFTISSQYVKDDFTINFFAHDSDYNYQVQKYINRRITTPPDKFSKSSTHVMWLVPNPNDHVIEEIKVEDSLVLIKAKALSTEPIPKSAFQVFLNNELTKISGSKIDEVTLKLDSTEGRYTHTYEERVHLKKGSNKIRVAVENPAGKDQTSPITIIYEPTKPRLHVVSIGVPFEDLAFTTTDARAFNNAFLQQEGGLYSDVIPYLLTTYDSTKGGEIRKLLEGLKTLSSNQEIQEKDVLALFISSHGILEEGQFRIRASDFDELYPTETSLDFMDQLLKSLSAIPCKKLLFFDACYSGNAIQNIDAIEGIPNLEILLSCSYGEQSYEDEKWKHGAFTKAILEIFEDPKEHSTSGSLNMDDIYNYVYKRVPQIVKTKRGKIPTNQVPIMIRSKGIKPTPIFAAPE